MAYFPAGTLPIFATAFQSVPSWMNLFQYLKNHDADDVRDHDRSDPHRERHVEVARRRPEQRDELDRAAFPSPYADGADAGQQPHPVAHEDEREQRADDGQEATGPPAVLRHLVHEGQHPLDERLRRVLQPFRREVAASREHGAGRDECGDGDPPGEHRVRHGQRAQHEKFFRGDGYGHDQFGF
jgi:hypothetical protein